MAILPEYFVPKPEYAKGGYIPPTGEHITFFDGDFTVPSRPRPSRKFPFEYQLLLKLGLRMDTLPEEGFLTRDGRIQFVLQSGRRIIEDGEPLVEFVHWTDEQEDVINACWHLIADECKVR